MGLLDEFLEPTEKQQKRVARALEAEHQIRHLQEVMAKGHVTGRVKIIPENLGERHDSVRPLCVEAIYSIWNQHKRPATKEEIISVVKQKIQGGVKMGRWKHKREDGSIWIPGVQTIDRCIRLTCDPKTADEEGRTSCIRLIDFTIHGPEATYLPNPNFFQDEVKEQIKRIVEQHQG